MNSNAEGLILIETFNLDAESSDCGYPWLYPNKQPRFIEPSAWSKKLADCRIEVELHEFFTDSEQIFHETGFPLFPFFLHHFCLPFSPILAEIHFRKERRERLNLLLITWNASHGRDKGLRLQLTQGFYEAMLGIPGHPHPGVELRMNPTQRESYCKRRGIPFNISKSESDKQVAIKENQPKRNIKFSKEKAQEKTIMPNSVEEFVNQAMDIKN